MIFELAGNNADIEFLVDDVGRVGADDRQRGIGRAAVAAGFVMAIDNDGQRQRTADEGAAGADRITVVFGQDVGAVAIDVPMSWPKSTSRPPTRWPQD